MNRADLLARLRTAKAFDLAIVGGGATGLGLALDAALRGFSVLLVEAQDFAGGTSSRATKLVHGGVRYLAQGNIGLVRESLRERATLLRNAPHLAQPLPFVLPTYRWWQKAFYGAGLLAYDALAGARSLGNTEFLSAAQTRALLPGVQAAGLRGGIKYWDGQFDDARLAIALARTAAAQGALLINYCEATGLLHEGGKVAGLRLRDAETGECFEVRARCTVNAAGVWVDALREQDGSATERPVKPVVAASQGVHLVVPQTFLPGRHALLVPATADGRVLFAVPWLGSVILGTTDTPRADLPREPRPLAAEVDFILREAGKVLAHAPMRADVRSCWVGLRPLVKPSSGEGGSTAGLSREHTVLVSPSGLVSVLGGKWTTYRVMAEDVLQACVDARLLPSAPAGASSSFALVGAQASQSPISAPAGLHLYGSEAEQVQALPGADCLLASGLSEAMVRYAVRHEYARCVEDVLARRSRLLFLDARSAADAAPELARLLRHEGIAEPREAAFAALARQYQELPG